MDENLSTYIQCPHDELYECNCLTKELKNKHVFKIHTRRCKFGPHANFEGEGFYSILKPGWKYMCDNPYANNKEAQDIVLKLCQIFEKKCTCSNVMTCFLCQYICHGSEENTGPTLNISFNQKWDLKTMFKLVPYLNLDSVQL